MLCILMRSRQLEHVMEIGWDEVRTEVAEGAIRKLCSNSDNHITAFADAFHFTRAQLEHNITLHDSWPPSYLSEMSK